MSRTTRLTLRRKFVAAGLRKATAQDGSNEGNVAMTELSNNHDDAANHEALANDAASEITKANRYALYYLADARNVMLDEMLFAGSEFLDRTITETQLFNEFLAKMAEAHSVKDIGAMYRECSRHQVEFIRRDTERLLKHSERVIDNTSRLIETWRQS